MASTGARHLNGMVILGDPIGKMRELIDLDLGLGCHGHLFNEVALPEDELYVLNQAVIAKEGSLQGVGGDQVFMDHPGVNVDAVFQEDELEGEDQDAEMADGIIV